MSDNTVQLTYDQRSYLRALLRHDIRKSYRSDRTMQRKVGDEYDPEHLMERLAFQHDVYEALGGDPRAITWAVSR